jgi:hypothetical protein
MRRAALIAAVLALVGAGSWFLRRATTAPDAPNATARTEPAAPPSPPTLEVRIPSATNPLPTATTGVGTGTASGAASATPNPGDGPIVCHLTFLGDGPRPSRVDLEVQTRGSIAPVRRRATADAWEVRLPRASEYFVNLTLDDWESDQWIHDARPTVDDRLELEVRLPTRPSIHVVDGTTGTALPGGEARQTLGDDLFMDERPTPGPESLKGRATPADAAGRIRLVKTARVSDWWVGAPRHSWTRVRVAPDDVARRVELAAGGALRVALEGAPAGEKTMVGASPAAEEDRRPAQAILAWDADAGLHGVEGLAPGRWIVYVGPAASRWVRETWTSAEVDVVAGRTTDVRLVVPHGAPRALRTVDFELVVPSGWNARLESIRIHGCADATEGIERSLDVPAEASLPWRVSVEGLKEGPYRVVVEPYGWSALVRVRPGTAAVRIEVPPPAAARVRVLDERDGRPLSGAHVWVCTPGPWASDPDEELPSSADSSDEQGYGGIWWSGTGCDLEERDRTSSYEGQVFAGVVMIHAHVDGYVYRGERVAIAASAEVFEHSIRLAQGGAIEVRITRDGKTFEAADGDVYVGPKADSGEDGGSWSSSMEANGGRTAFDGLERGAYVVSWRPSRSEVRLSKEVSVAPGQTVKVEFEAPAPPR